MVFKKQSLKQKPQPMDDEPTPVAGSPSEFIAHAEPVLSEINASLDQLAAAQRLAAKVAKLLTRSRVPVADQLRIAHMALLAVAAGPKSAARDIAVMALKVVG